MNGICIKITHLTLCASLLLCVALLSACLGDASGSINGDAPRNFQYTCENGTAVEGTTTDQSAQQNCMSCDDGFGISGIQCVQEFQYTCENGTAVEGTTTDQSAQQNCMSCDDGFGMSGIQCVQEFQFACEDGIGAITMNADADITNNNCARCNADRVLYTINGTERQECADNASGMLSNGVTIICPGVAIGDTFEVEGEMYTRHSAGSITPANAATACTTGITDMETMFANESAFNENISTLGCQQGNQDGRYVLSGG